MAAPQRTLDIWLETRQGLRERIKNHLDAADASPDPADDMALVDQLTRITMMTLREFADTLGPILATAQRNALFSSDGSYRAYEGVSNLVEEWALSLSQSIDDLDKTLPFIDDDLKRSRQKDLGNRELREQIVNPPAPSLATEVLKVMFDIFPNLREDFGQSENHRGHNCSMDPDRDWNKPDIEFGDGTIGEFKTAPDYDDVPAKKPTIKDCADRVTGMPATIFTPPEDLVPNVHQKIMDDINANSDKD